MINVSNTAIASLMRTGMLDSPRPGSSITIAPTRANTSMKAAARAGSSEISMRISYTERGESDGANVASAAYDSRRQPHHVAMQRIRHERQSQQQRDEDRQNFRHEHQGLLLNLGERLKQRDDDTDHENHHHRSEEHTSELQS